VGAALDRVLGRERRTAPPEPADDVRALVGCLYAALTARWPERDVPGPTTGLRPAPLTGGRDGRTCSPRQVRAGVPRGLEQAVVQGLGQPGHTTADELLDALQRAEQLDAAARAPAPRRRRRRPAVPRAVARSAALAWSWPSSSRWASFFQRLGTRSWARAAGRRPLEALRGEHAVTVARRGAVDRRAARPVGAGTARRVSNPPSAGGDGRENDGAVPNAVDRRPRRPWDTER
jgi:hypothetical protein